MLSFGVMASGNGSNFLSVLKGIEEQNYPAVCSFLIVNNASCGAARIAQEYGIPVFYISGKTHPEIQEYEAALLQIFKENPVDLLVLAGFMKKLPDSLIDLLPDRILNIHPALLPKFGGKGFFGIHVHEAVIQAKEKESGATVHLVTKQIDGGKILSQVKVPVLESDTPEILAARVLEQEHALYLKTILEYAKKLKFLD